MKKKRSTGLAFLLCCLVFAVCPLLASSSWAQEPQPTVAELRDLLDSPLGKYLSGAGLHGLRLMTGRVSRLPRPEVSQSSTLAVGPGPEIRVNDPTGDPDNRTTQSETTIAVSGQNVVIGWNDSAACCVAGSTRFSGYGVSLDGGNTFTDKGVIPAPPGVDTFGDPSLTADSTGNFYYATLLGQGTLSAIGVAKSTDGGQTFPTLRRADISPTRRLTQDKPYITADKSPTSPFRDTLYIAWGSFSIFGSDIDFARSTDGGLTWSPAIAINGGGTLKVANGAVPAVDRDGRVYVAWEDFRPGLPTGQAVFIARSDNGGVTFVGERKIADVAAIGSPENCGGSIRNTLNGSIRVTEFPTIAVDTSTGPNSGNIYVAWNDNRNVDPDILFARSSDHGLTWSAPIRVNDDATTADQWLPWMTVDPAGVIYLIWYDRRLDSTNRLIDVFAARSMDGGQTFQNVRVTSISFDAPPINPNFDPGVGDCYMGDYNGLTADPTTVYITWGDNRDLVGSRPDPNVFFRKAVVR